MDRNSKEWFVSVSEDGEKEHDSFLDALADASQGFVSIIKMPEGRYILSVSAPFNEAIVAKQKIDSNKKNKII